jgi:hypothetical protein
MQRSGDPNMGRAAGGRGSAAGLLGSVESQHCGESCLIPLKRFGDFIGHVVCGSQMRDEFHASVTGNMRQLQFSVVDGGQPLILGPRCLHLVE